MQTLSVVVVLTADVLARAPTSNWSVNNAATVHALRAEVKPLVWGK